MPYDPDRAGPWWDDEDEHWTGPGAGQDYFRGPDRNPGGQPKHSRRHTEGVPSREDWEAKYPGIPYPHTPTPSGGPEPGGGGGPEGGGPEWTYETPPYGGPYRPIYNFEDVPQFEAPEFLPPSYEDALNEPGYRFRLDESTKALQRSAAAKGVLRGGGTLSGIVERAQNMASAEYGNVWNRALQAHQEDYKGARDEYMPNLLEWQTLTAAEQRAGDLEWQRYWDAYMASLDDQYRYKHMVYTTP